MKYLSAKKFSRDAHPSIHYTGSVRGMKSLDYGENMINVFVVVIIFIIYLSGLVDTIFGIKRSD